MPPPRSHSIDIRHTLIFCFIRASILYTSTVVQTRYNRDSIPIETSWHSQLAQKRESQFYSDSQTANSTSREIETESQRTRAIIPASSISGAGTTTLSRFLFVKKRRILSGSRKYRGKDERFTSRASTASSLRNR